jgi:hypothetical protein
VARVGDDPQAGVGNGFGHLDGNFDGVEGIAVALDDKSACLNGGEERRSEVHVVVTGGEGRGAVEKSFDLRIAAGMAAVEESEKKVRDGQWRGAFLWGRVVW